MKLKEFSNQRSFWSKLFKRVNSPAKITFIVAGVVSTVWFLIRVIPKPSRATYPCVRTAAPWASAFVIYLIGLSGSFLSFKKFGYHLRLARFPLAIAFLFSGLALSLISLTQNNNISIANLVDTNRFLANDPIGTAKGIKPGRVSWAWNPEATNENLTNTNGDYWFMDKNADPEIIAEMLEESLKTVAGKASSKDAWNAIFKYFNQTHGRGDVGYKAGEKIMIKLNNTNQSSGPAMDSSPQLVEAMLKQLIEIAGVKQEDITIGDPYRYFSDIYYVRCYDIFPNVKYMDSSGEANRTQTVPTNDDLLLFSNGETSSRLPQAYVDATYFINMACLKSHNEGGITLCAKNHQGSVLGEEQDAGSQFAIWLHPYLPANDEGYGNYRHIVDYMGHEHMGGKTLLYLVDGIWAGKNWSGIVEKWDMHPFNGDYPSSIFLSLDAVAIESVGFDFLIEEYSNKPQDEQYPYIDGTEDYILQAASKENWPSGIKYDPEGDGSEIGSLGVSEHWNNSTDKQYSRNLGTGEGIELVKTGGPVSLDDISKNNFFKAFPNPATDIITIKLLDKSILINSIKIYDSNGQLRLSSSKRNSVSADIQNLNISELKPGAYFIQIKHSQGESVEQIIKIEN